MFADYHVHTYYSDDSECPMEEMIRRGEETGIDEIAFTDHVDYGMEDHVNCDYDKYFTELERRRSEHSGKISIKSGIEFGIQPHTAKQFSRDFAAYPFDFVLLSCHQVDNKDLWRNVYQEGKTQDEFQRGYYECIYETVKIYKDYSVLGHLDVIKRYDRIGDYPDEKIMDIVDEILKIAIADGKGIEVNTSSFRYGLKDLTPSRKILKRYLELGGKILTIGSDAHESGYLGTHIMEVREILKDMGYKSFFTFDRMVPTERML